MQRMFTVRKTAVPLAGCVGNLLAGIQNSRLRPKDPRRELKEGADVLSPCACLDVIPGGQIRALQGQ
jgi:hypothetical protein